MDDLISRQAAYEALTDYYHHRLDIQHDALKEALGRVPTAEKRERWVYDEERGATGIYAVCTACNEMIYQTGKFNYCPNCGARMEN